MVKLLKITCQNNFFFFVYYYFRHSVLDDIKEMSSSLGEWEIERDLQNNIYTEIQELKERLKKAEKKLELQKEKLNTIQPKVTQYHEKINNGRKECFKLSKMCDNLGQIINGPDYKFVYFLLHFFNLKNFIIFFFPITEFLWKVRKY